MTDKRQENLNYYIDQAARYQLDAALLYLASAKEAENGDPDRALVMARTAGRLYDASQERLARVEAFPTPPSEAEMHTAVTQSQAYKAIYTHLDDTQLATALPQLRPLGGLPPRPAGNDYAHQPGLAEARTERVILARGNLIDRTKLHAQEAAATVGHTAVATVQSAGHIAQDVGRGLALEASDAAHDIAHRAQAAGHTAQRAGRGIKHLMERAARAVRSAAVTTVQGAGHIAQDAAHDIAHRAQAAGHTAQNAGTAGLVKIGNAAHRIGDLAHDAAGAQTPRFSELTAADAAAIRRIAATANTIDIANVPLAGFTGNPDASLDEIASRHGIAPSPTPPSSQKNLPGGAAVPSPSKSR